MHEENKTPKSIAIISLNQRLQDLGKDDLSTKCKDGTNQILAKP